MKDEIPSAHDPMRLFANLFLLLFLADGGISLLDELVSLIFTVEPLSVLRNVLANSVIVMAVPLYLCLGMDRRLHKRLFLPLILFVFCCPLFTWFFPALGGTRTYGLIAAASQVAICIFFLYCFRKKGTRSLALPPAMFDAPFFSLKNTLLFGAANLFVIPLVLVMLALSAANSYLATQTSGFMHLKPDGLYMTERTYWRDNRIIRLAGMIHVGDKEYYDDLVGSVEKGRTIVLAEGVTDDENRLQNGFNFGRVAGFLGLSSQEKLDFRGRMIEEEDLDASRLHSRGRGEKGRSGQVDILRADLDVSDFRPSTILFLNIMGKQLRESPSFVKGLLSLNAWAEKNITPEINAVIMDDILHRRNREVIRHLGKALEHYDTVVIPWGALHMKEIEGEVLKRGFELREERERVSIDFRKMLLGMF